ncbi:MAG: 6-phosphogluconolactonase [Neisseria sp.]|uniref:6-phosphogluconolactonase n=1 Tax=Neisseria sp. TaxID=192066 RepID=UPI0026DC4966|nr:6-phosphogluconolactonase [Neisseria sp.]MDO4249314.1 6-phosphogluconolactonase [Neisseria sp.]
MTYQLHEHSDAAVAAQAQAEAVASALKQALAEKGRAVLAVSGGKSPIAFFEALSQFDLDWKNVGITLVDERIVPVNHADSNTGLVHQYLLKNKAAAAGWIPVIAEDADEAALADSEQAVAFALQHYQQPDVLVLGMGGDGHTASLFPQAPQLDKGLDLSNEVPLLHTTPVTAPHERISMTLAAIEKTPTVLLAIAGADKKEVFDQAAATVDKKFPVSFVLNSEKVACHVHYTR